MKHKLATSMEEQEKHFNEVLARIRQAKQRAFQLANATLVELYWNIGRYVSSQVINESWGKGVVADLAGFIQSKEPNVKGFTARNIWRMKQFYETYKENPKLSPLVTQLSWTNNLLIISSSKYDVEREFYVNIAIKERYTKRELERQIKSGLFERAMLADKKLSTAVRQLPQDTSNVFKDSYVLEFLQLPQKHTENELQQAILSSLKDFVLKIGKDFCFMGQEYKVQVGETDFSIDLLFYHRGLRSLVAFELKNEAFHPSHLGQLEFYLEALDRDIKKENESPSIGVLLCRKKNDEVVQYALSRSVSPTVIADYETQLIPKEILRKKMNEFYELLMTAENS